MHHDIHSNRNTFDIKLFDLNVNEQISQNNFFQQIEYVLDV